MSDRTKETLGEIIEKAVSRYMTYSNKIKELKLEIERLQGQLSQQEKETKEAPNPYEAPYCRNRAVNKETGQWFCEGKKIDKSVCVTRQQWCLETKGWKNCYPFWHKFKPRRRFKKSQDPFDDDYPVDNRGSIYRGET